MGPWPGTEVMEALGLRGRSVTWHLPRWGEKPAGLRLGEKERTLGTGRLQDNRAARERVVVVQCALTTGKHNKCSPSWITLDNISVSEALI